MTLIKKEKYELNRENEELKEKNKNLFQSLSEVRAKVIELQDEKLSLITALKLIQRESVLLAEKKKIEDLESENKNLRAAARTLQEYLDKSNREK
jgi:RNase H-fold protein (predicted Holliday junction resolvase)